MYLGSCRKTMTEIVYKNGQWLKVNAVYCSKFLKFWVLTNKSNCKLLNKQKRVVKNGGNLLSIENYHDETTARWRQLSWRGVHGTRNELFN